MSNKTEQISTPTSKTSLHKFSFSNPFYDLNTYAGRFKSVWASTNPLLFFVNKNQINSAKDTLSHYKELEDKNQKRGENLMLTKEEIAKIKDCDSIVRSAVHPDTGNVIP